MGSAEIYDFNKDWLLLMNFLVASSIFYCLFGLKLSKVLYKLFSLETFFNVKGFIGYPYTSKALKAF